MLKDLVRIANKLDSIGLTKEADVIDGFLRKVSHNVPQGVFDYRVQPGNTFSGIVSSFGDSSKTYEEQVSLNKKYNPKFNPDKLSIGQIVYIYVPETFEDIQPTY